MVGIVIAAHGELGTCFRKTVNLFLKDAKGIGCLTLIKNKKPPKALMGLFFLSNLPNISCGMLRDVLLYK